MEELSSQKIADIVGADRKTIDQWLAKAKIPKRGFGGSRGIKSKEWLIEEYFGKGKSFDDLAKDLDLNKKTVHQWFVDYKIPRRPKYYRPKGEDSKAWKGGRCQSNGYILIFSPNHPLATKQGYVAEHRLVVERILGRYLKPEEVVHHINFKKDDNHFENLYLFATQPEHQGYHIAYKFGYTGLLKSNLKE